MILYVLIFKMIFFCLPCSLFSMALPPLLTEDAVQVIAVSWGDLQTLGRIGQLNRRYNELFYKMVLCDPESLPRCFLALQDDFDRATLAVQFYARQWFNSVGETSRVYDLFCHVFNYHEFGRTKGFSTLQQVLWADQDDKPSCFMRECISWYAGQWPRHLNSANIQDNSKKLHYLLERCYLIGAEIFLIGNPSFDIFWNGCNAQHPDNLAYKSCDRCRTFLPNHMSIFKLLFSRRMSINTILSAIELGSQNVCWDSIVELAIRWSKKFSHYDSLVRKLLQKQYDRSSPVRWDIYYDALYEKTDASEVIDVLFDNDLKARHVCDETIYLTLLSYAVCHKKLPAIRHLLAKGANPNEIDCLGTPVFHQAYDSAEITEALIQAGADVDIAKDDGTTALLALPQRYEWNEKREQVLRVLLKHKAEVNKRDNKGKTALHYFADFKEGYNGRNCEQAFQMILVLLKHGADIWIKDNEGKTALNYAQERDNLTVINMLLAHENKLKIERYSLKMERLKKMILYSSFFVVACLLIKNIIF